MSTSVLLLWLNNVVELFSTGRGSVTIVLGESSTVIETTSTDVNRMSTVRPTTECGMLGHR